MPHSCCGTKVHTSMQGLFGTTPPPLPIGVQGIKWGVFSGWKELHWHHADAVISHLNCTSARGGKVPGRGGGDCHSRRGKDTCLDASDLGGDLLFRVQGDGGLVLGLGLVQDGLHAGVAHPGAIEVLAEGGLPQHGLDVLVVVGHLLR